MKTLKVLLVLAMFCVSLLASAAATTVTIQPNSDGNDVWIEDGSNKNSYSFLLVGKAKNYPKKRTLLEFVNLSQIPAGSIITDSKLEVYHYGFGCPTGSNDTPINRSVSLHEVLVGWQESQATRDVRLISGNSSIYWNESYVGLNNIDAKSTAEATVLWTTSAGVWRSYTITSLTQKWVDNSSANNGVLLWATNEGTDGCDMRSYSSEYTNASLRPRLVVTYEADSQPVANASASPMSGTEPLSVNFTGSVSGGNSPFTYLWNFQDGTNSTLQNPGHTFVSNGNYNVSFRVTDYDGDISYSYVLITVNNNSPVANASATPTSGNAPLGVNFTGSVAGGNSPFTYFWNFQDGTNSSQQNPPHTFSSGGNYNVSFKVTDYDGDISYSYVLITVCARANPTVRVTPDYQSGYAGQMLNYTVNVTNGDSATCGSSTFSLSKTIPTNWTGNFDSSNLVISPGAYGTTIFRLTSYWNSSLGNYTFYNNATNVNASSYKGSDSAIYIVV